MFKSSHSLPSHHTHTLDDEIARFLAHYRLQGYSETTLDAFSNALGQLMKFLGGEGVTDIREVSSDILQRYGKQIMERVSRESAHLYLRTIKMFFRFLTEGNRLLIDPAGALVLPKLHRKTVGSTLTEEEMKMLLAVPDTKKPTGLRDRAMVEFLYSTALRVSELRRMKVEDIDLDQSTAHVVEGKGAKDRVVPVGESAGTWLARYLEDVRPFFVGKRDAEALFLSRWGNPFSEQMMAMHLKQLGRDAGLKVNLTCHVIRRTVATRLLANGASPQEVAALLGHQDVRSLGRYVAFAARELKQIHQSTHPREQEHE